MAVKTSRARITTAPDGSKRLLASNVVFGYGDNNTAVNFTPQRVNNATFDGWQVTTAPWTFRLGKPLVGDLLNKDGTFAMGINGSWIGAHLERFVWFDWSTKTITPIGSAANYNRANLSNEIVTIDGVPVQSITTWTSIFPNADLKIYAEGSALKNELYAHQAARNAANSLAPAGNPYLVGLYHLDLINAPRALKNGALQNLLDFDDDATSGVEWQNALGEFLAFMPVDKCWIENEDGTRPYMVDPETGLMTTEIDNREYPLRKRVFTDNGKLWLAVGIQKSVLDAMPEGTLVFDPTLDIQPDESSGIDTFIRSGTPTNNYETDSRLAVQDSDFNRSALLGWDISSISPGASVSSGTLTLTSKFADASRTNEVHELLVSFVESEATWNQRSSGVGWNSAGANGVGSDFNGTAEDTGTLSSTSGTATDFDVLSAVQNNLGGTMYLIVRDNGATGYGEWDSSSATTASRRPQLEVVYTPPASDMAGTSAGSATATAALAAMGTLAGAIGAVASASASIVATGVLSGVSNGVATATATLTATVAISGTATGAATASGALSASGVLSGATAGVGTATADLAGIGSLSGQADGAAVVTGTLSSTAALSGATSGSATATGSLVATAVLSGQSDGAATANGVLIASGLLSGTASGLATITGSLLSSGALSGVTAGTSTASGALTGEGALSSTAAGVATANGLLLATGALSGSTAGQATVTGNLTALTDSDISGTAAGVATASGTLIATGVLSGTSAGIAAANSTMTATGLLSGAATGASTTSGTLTGTAALSGLSTAAATVSGALSGAALIAGSAAGQSTVTGVALGIGTLSGVSAAQALVVGSIMAYGALAGTAAGSSTATLQYTGVVSEAPPERIFVINAESRIFYIPAESRVFYIETENRVYSVKE